MAIDDPTLLTPSLNIPQGKETAVSQQVQWIISGILWSIRPETCSILNLLAIERGYLDWPWLTLVFSTVARKRGSDPSELCKIQLKNNLVPTLGSKSTKRQIPYFLKFYFIFFPLILFYFIFKLYKIVLVLPKLVHWDDPEGWYGEGGGRRVQDGEHMYTCGRLILIFS